MKHTVYTGTAFGSGNMNINVNISISTLYKRPPILKDHILRCKSGGLSRRVPLYF